MRKRGRMRALRRGARYLLTTQRAIICRQGFFGGVKLVAAFICFAVGSISLILGGTEALALQQHADAEQWLAALLPAMVGLMFVGGGFAALCSRR